MNSEDRRGGGDRREGVYTMTEIHEVSLLLGRIDGRLGALENTVNQQHAVIDNMNNILTNYRLKIVGISTTLSIIATLIVSAIVQ